MDNLEETKIEPVAPVVEKKKRRRRKKAEVKSEVKSEAEPTVPPPAPVDVISATAVVEKPKKPKRTRAPSSYNEFVRLKMSDPKVKGLPHRTKFSEISKMWKLEKAKGK